MVKIKCCRKNFNTSDLWVSSHDTPSDFYASSFVSGDAAWPLLVLRILLFLIAVAILTWSLILAGNAYWFLFLTNWGMLFVAAMLFSGIIVSFMAVSGKIPDDQNLPFFVSLYWFLFNVAISMSLLISLLYWTLIYGPELKEDPQAFSLELLMHGANAILVMFELLCSRTPVRMLHFYMPVSIGLWYAIFTAIYFLCGGTNGYGSPFIYDILNWEYGKRSTLVVILAAVVQVLIYFLVYGIAILRDKHVTRTSSAAVVLATSHNHPNFVSSV